MLNAGLFAAAGYVLLDPDYHAWLGAVAVGLAAIYALMAWLTLRSRPDHVVLLAVLLATSMGFVALVFPLQAEAAWIAVGWAAQGLVLWWFGLRLRAVVVRGLAAVFLALAAGRLLLVDTLLEAPHSTPFVPLFNGYGLPAALVVAALLAAAALSYRSRPRPMSADFVAMRVWSVGGFLLLWMVVSVESYDFFMTRLGRAVEGVMPDYERWAQTALSVAWALYAAGVLLIGFRFRSRPLRWLALGIFLLTLGKVVLVDTQALTGFYRVTAYLVLALVMFGAAWAYQKVKRTFTVPAAENTP